MSEPNTITEHTKITDHAARALATLMGALRSKPRMAALANDLGTRAQLVEDALWSVLALTLDNAEDNALEQYGELVGQRRGALDNAAYRAVLRATVRARMSSGTRPDVIAVVALAVGAIPFTTTNGVASYCVELGAPLTWDPQVLADLLEITVAAGIGHCLVAPFEALSDAFTLSEDAFVATPSTATGFADSSAPGDGGQLVGAYT